MKDFHIYIPTLSRVDRQVTLQSIPKDWLRDTHLVVYKDEVKSYQKKYDIDIMSVDEIGTAPARQHIMNHAHSKYALMLDDDMTFSCRREKDNIKLFRCTEMEVITMFQLLYTWLEEGFVHVGISQRGGNNYVLEEYKENTRMNNAYAYNVKEFYKAGAEFRLTGMEDFDVTLTLLEKGLPNRVTFKYCWDQKGSGTEGGCSVYRTYQMQKDVAHKLYQLHPNLVRIVSKESKTSWKSLGSSQRIDVDILWNKVKLCTEPNLAKWKR